MGILNVTPDSFSDGGAFGTVTDVVRVARRMAQDGASVLDVGGESTRPGAEPVPLDEELRRVVPAVRALAEAIGLPISVDTKKAAVFAEAYEAGASMLNDVSGCRADPDMPWELARTEAAVCLMHARGDPTTMDARAVYDDLVADVAAELESAAAAVIAAGVPSERIVFDPGLGFAKTNTQCWSILRDIARLKCGRPLLVGGSRKRFLAAGLTHAGDRDVATAVLSALLDRAGVEMVRVHAVGPTRDAIAVSAAWAGVSS